MGAIAAVAGSLIGAATAAAPAIGAAAGVYSIVEGKRQAKKAESAAEKLAQQEYEFMERRAGEHFDLTQQQMELQSMYANISTLADVIVAKREPTPPQVFTIPPAKTYGVIARINQAIDDAVRAA